MKHLFFCFTVLLLSCNSKYKESVSKIHYENYYANFHDENGNRLSRDSVDSLVSTNLIIGKERIDQIIFIYDLNPLD